MSLVAESGNGWEIERRFIDDPDHIKLLEAQAWDLIWDDKPTDFDDETTHEQLHDVTVYEFTKSQSLDPPEFAGYLHALAPDLMEAVESLTLERSGPVDDFMAINVYAPGGWLGLHKDIGEVDRDVLSLSGVRIFSVYDLLTKKLHQFRIEPGDRVTVYNADGRPDHMAYNDSPTQVSLSIVK